MKYGWKRDLPDFRDKKFEITALDVLPESIDLRNNMPPIYDQKTIGSCTANAIAGAIEYDQKKNGMPEVYIPSRLFIYYQERVIENTVNSDNGAMIRDGIKACASVGACKESTWGYDISRFTENPPQPAYDEALNHKIITYRSVNQDLNSLKSALASGYPIIFGFTVFSSFESEEVAKTGIVPMPNPNESCLGGHATLICGYSDSTSRFLVRNSWGESWGIQGYFWLPYDLVSNPSYASDFWVIDTTN
jgi:C1A family cysteine protease